jgi:hypothetical protein
MERGQDRDPGRERAYEPAPSGARAGREEVPGTTHQGLGDTSARDRHDAIHWQSIVAGALAAISTFLLLGLLALGIDLLVDEDSGAAIDVVSVIIGFISFLVGGYVAGRILGEHRDAPAEGAREVGRHGVRHGLLTWALATLLILVLSGLGLGTLFGPVGDMMGPLDPEQISQAARDAALGAFLSLLLWAIAAVVATLGAIVAMALYGRATGRRRS